MYAIFLLLPEKPSELKRFDAALFEASESIYKRLSLYRCVKYLRRWKGVPWRVKRWLYSKYWDNYARIRGGKKELSDVRNF